jgi:hypothetical protein
MNASSLVEHWRKLTGAVHPDDVKAFAHGSQGFHLGYPPPAYIGAVDTAPVVILMKNGGYDPKMTPAEFLEPDSVAKYLDRLHNPGPVEPADVSPYYENLQVADHLRSGKVAIVNAVAYRFGRGIEKSPVTRRLPSLAVHRNWLVRELLPAAERQERLVIAHRVGLWNMPPFSGQAAVIRTTNPVSPFLMEEVLQAIDEWPHG